MRVDLAFLLNQAAYAFAAQLGAKLAELDLTVRDFCVLLKAAEEERTQTIVAQLAKLDTTTMVSTLDGLERAGLAERRVSSSDRRARIVAVTAKGRGLLDKAIVAVDAAVEEALSVLEPADRETFLRSLTALTAGPWATPFHATVPQRRRQVRPSRANTG